MVIPSGLSSGLALTSSFASSALIIRHSIREAIPAGETGNNIPLTAEGRQLAELLGESISSRLASVTSSPIGRCTETAEHILRGARFKAQVPTSTVLGDPGVFIADGQKAWANFQALGTKGVMMHISREKEALPGMKKPLEAAYALLEIMMRKCRDSGLHVFVTHDVILASKPWTRRTIYPVSSKVHSSGMMACIFMEATGTELPSSDRRINYHYFDI